MRSQAVYIAGSIRQGRATRGLITCYEWLKLWVNFGREQAEEFLNNIWNYILIGNKNYSLKGLFSIHNDRHGHGKYIV